MEMPEHDLSLWMVSRGMIACAIYLFIPGAALLLHLFLKFKGY